MKPVFGDPQAIAAVREARRPEWVRKVARATACLGGHSAGNMQTIGYDVERDVASLRCFMCSRVMTVNNKGEVV